MNIVTIELYISPLDHVRKQRFNSIVLFDVYKQIILILSCLSDSEQGGKYSYFQAEALFFSLRTNYVFLGVINTIYKHCQT